MLKEYLTNIANAIRSKLGTTDKVNAQDFVNKVNEVYDKGKYDEWSNFWDKYQLNGAKREYAYAFALGWGDKTFYPKYDIKLIGNRQTNMFYNFGYAPGSYWISANFDLAERLEECGVVLDTSQATNLSWCFCQVPFTRTPAISTVSMTSLNQLFYKCPFLETIDKVIFKSDGSQTIGSTAFHDLPLLKNLTVEGLIGKSISLSSAPLSVDSMKSIITHLVDHSTSAPLTYKVTFKSTCWEELEASGKPYDDGLTDNTETGWREYVMSVLGWNT